MTLQSFNARLRTIDPNLRLRKRTGWVISKAQGYAMCGIYRRTSYINIACIAGDLPYQTRPIIWRKERVPGMLKPQKYMHSQMRRGRASLIQLLNRHIPRWGTQLLKI